jgi:phage shock protein E
MKIRLRTAMAACVLLVATQACGSGSRPSETASITAEQLAALIAAGDAPFVLDVRSEAEFAAGHIPGAVNVPHTELADRLDQLPSDRGAEIVVHCQSGRRAQSAESVLAEAGFTKVLDLSGHMAGWREGNHPVE